MSKQSQLPTIKVETLGGAIGPELQDQVLSGDRVAIFVREPNRAWLPGEKFRLLDRDNDVIMSAEIMDVAATSVATATWAQVEAEGSTVVSLADWQAKALTPTEAETDAVDPISPMTWLRFKVLDPRLPLPPRPTAGDLELPEGYRHAYSGKVRDLFATPDHNLLVVASDRISAYDWVLPSPIPDKGAILTQMSLWWFDQLADIVPNHVLSTEVPARVRGRAVICETLQIYPVECVVRGYLAGSGLADYQQSGEICGVPLPEGLVEGDALAEPIFTPATKAVIGEHDENISLEQMQHTVGRDTATQLREMSLKVYELAEQIARQQGILVADTKFEFGHRADGSGAILADEVLTPDSSRFWPLDKWQPGRSQPSFDKQFARDWLTSAESGWSRSSGEPPPPLPEHIVEQTAERYRQAYRQLVGSDFSG